jgi:hypothetical protein
VKPHDCEGLTDIQCWFADHFFERLRHWRCQPIEDRLCQRIAFREAQDKYQLEADELENVRAYLAERTKLLKSEPLPELSMN